MEYPTAHRKAAMKYGEAVQRNLPTKAFEEEIRRRLETTYGRDFADKILPLKKGARLTRYPRQVPDFGKRGLGDLATHLFEQQLRKKGAKILIRALPVVGDVLLAKDIYDTVGEIITYLTEPGRPGRPFNPDESGADWAGWTKVEYGDAYYPFRWEQRGLRREDFDTLLYSSRAANQIAPFQSFRIVAPEGENFPPDPWFLGFGTTLTVPATATEVQTLHAFYDDLSGQPAINGSTVTIRYRTDLSVPNPITEPDLGTPERTYPFFDETGLDVQPMPELIPGYGKEVAEGSNEDSSESKDPTKQPAAITIVTPGSAPIVGIGLHPLDPPPTGTKERKFVAASAQSLRIVSEAMNQFTEAEDAIESLWDTLPDEVKTGYVRQRYRGAGGKLVEYWRPKRIKTAGGNYIYAKPRLDNMWADVYRHWDKVDVHKAIENLAKNQVQDMLIGSVAGGSNKRFRKFYGASGKPVGFFTGPAL